MIKCAYNFLLRDNGGAKMKKSESTKKVLGLLLCLAMIAGLLAGMMPVAKAVVSESSASLTKLPTANKRVYDGQEASLLNSDAECSGGTLQYVLGSDNQTAPTSGWSSTIPKATDAKLYYVWVKVHGDNSHTDSQAECITTRICFPIKFSVVNGEWNDATGGSQDRYVGVTRYADEDLALVLNADDIPAVDTSKPGSWGTDNPNDYINNKSITDAKTFTYTYEAEKTGSITFIGTKTLTGRQLTANDVFEFEILENNVVVATGTNDATGKINYSTINYTNNEVGQHNYTVREKDTSIPGVTKDNQEYEVSVNVMNEAGKADLTVNPTENFSILNFTNTFTPASMTVSAPNVEVDYDGKPHGITVSVTDPANGASVKFGEVQGTCNLDASPTITNVVDSPKTVFYQVTADNYETVTGSATITINKANQNAPATPPTAVPTAAPTKVPRTGDSAAPLLWIVMLLLGLAGFTVFSAKKR